VTRGHCPVAATVPSLIQPLRSVSLRENKMAHGRVVEDSVRGRMLGVAGVGAVAGMVLWGGMGVRSLAGPTAVFTFVFLVVLVLSAVCEGLRRCRR